MSETSKSNMPKKNLGNTGNTTLQQQTLGKQQTSKKQASRVVGDFMVHTFDDSEMIQGERKVDKLSSMCFGPIAAAGFKMTQREAMRTAANRDYSQMSNVLKKSGFRGIELTNADVRADIRSFNAYIARGQLNRFSDNDFLKISQKRAGEYYNGVKLSQRDIDMINKYVNALSKSKANLAGIKNGINSADSYLTSRGLKGIKNLSTKQLKEIIDNNGKYRNITLSSDDILVLQGLINLKKDDQRIKRYQKFSKQSRKKALRNYVKHFQEADMIQGAQNVARGWVLYKLYLKSQYLLGKGIMYGAVGFARVGGRKIDKVASKVGYMPGGAYDKIKANVLNKNEKIKKAQKKINILDNKKKRKELLKEKMRRLKARTIIKVKKTKFGGFVANKFSILKNRVKNSVVGRMFHLGGKTTTSIFKVFGKMKKALISLIIGLGAIVLIASIVYTIAMVAAGAASSILSFFTGDEEDPNVTMAQKAMNNMDLEYYGLMTSIENAMKDHTEVVLAPHSGREITITTDDKYVNYINNMGVKIPSANLKKEVLSMAAVYTNQDTKYSNKSDSKYHTYCKTLLADGITFDATKDVTYERYYCPQNEIANCSNLQTDTWTHTEEETAEWTDADWDTKCGNYTTEESEKTYHGTGNAHILIKKNGKVIDGPTDEECDNYGVNYTYVGNRIVASYYCKGHSEKTRTCNSHTENFCPGHIKATATVLCRGFDGENNLFQNDSLSIANTGKPWVWNYRDEEEDDDENKLDKWDGWTPGNMNWARTLRDQDWYSMYGISMGDGTPIGTEEAKTYLSKINTWWISMGHPPLSQERQTFLTTALSKIGSWSYCLRDKPESTATSFAAMDSEYCVNNDCSGYVSYCIWKSGFQINGVQSTSSFLNFQAKQKLNGAAVEDNGDILVPGDIIFKTGSETGRSYGHVVIFLGKVDDRILIAECSSSNNIGTTLSGYEKIVGKGYTHVISLNEFPD